MNCHYIFTSLTRISKLENQSFEVQPLPKEQWESGDYVAGEIIDTGANAGIELPNGHMIGPLQGERLIGSLGVRHATLEATGTWKLIPPSGKMHMLTGAGLLGIMTSRSVFAPYPVELTYLGHVMLEGQKAGMLQMVAPVAARPFITPVVLLTGTSMSAGKTTTARIVTRQLKLLGFKVLGAKLTGAGRYRDILAIKDAGADVIIDFVDAGLPSTVCSRARFQAAMQYLKSRMAHAEADVAVVEIGASPLEPYNGDEAIRQIMDNVRCTILCASDPYSVYGVMKSFNLKPDLVSGPATNTIAGVELVEKLCSVKARNLLQPENLSVLQELLCKTLSISG